MYTINIKWNIDYVNLTLLLPNTVEFGRSYVFEECRTFDRLLAIHTFNSVESAYNYSSLNVDTIFLHNVLYLAYQGSLGSHHVL